MLKPGSATTRKILSLAIGVAAIVVLSNCSKQEDAATTFSTVYAETLSKACTQCHTTPGSGSQNGATLNFSNQANAYSSLTAGNVSGGSSVNACGSVRIVAGGSPAASYLIGTIIQRYSSGSFAGVSGCTPYAGHFSSLNLTEAQQNHLVSWVQGGAQNN